MFTLLLFSLLHHLLVCGNLTIILKEIKKRVCHFKYLHLLLKKSQ